jgi:hypothetical protein
MMLKRLRLLTLILVALLLVTGSAMRVHGDEQPAYKLYIGTVSDKPDEFVGVAVAGTDVTIYICDGQADKGTVSIAEWFLGELADNAVEIIAPSGNRVVGLVKDDTIVGEFTFKDGTVKKFSLTLGDANTALNRSDFAFGDEHFIGGWLILGDGSVRGAVLKKEGNILVPADFIAFSNVDIAAKR